MDYLIAPKKKDMPLRDKKGRAGITTSKFFKTGETYCGEDFKVATADILKSDHKPTRFRFQLCKSYHKHALAITKDGSCYRIETEDEMLDTKMSVKKFEALMGWKFKLTLDSMTDEPSSNPNKSETIFARLVKVR